MKPFGQNHIDYWQSFCPAQRGLKTRFGVRVQDGRCWALIQIACGEPYTVGQPQDLPVDPSTLPTYLRVIVDQHVLNDPNSDLFEVLAGEKSVEEAIHAPTKTKLKETTTGPALRLPHAS